MKVDSIKKMKSGIEGVNLWDFFVEKKRVQKITVEAEKQETTEAPETITTSVETTEDKKDKKGKK